MSYTIIKRAGHLPRKRCAPVPIRRSRPISWPRVLLPNAENVGVAYYLTSTGKRVGIFREDWVKALGIRRSENCLSGEAFQAQVTEFEKRIREVLLSIFAGEFPAKTKRQSDMQLLSLSRDQPAGGGDRMSFEPTPPQRVAIESIYQDTVVTAGAGSGKTRGFGGAVHQPAAKRLYH